MVRRVLLLPLVLLALAAPAAAQPTTTVRTDRLIASTQAIVGGTTLGANTLNVTGTLGVSAGATIGTTLTVDTSTLVVDATNNRVGVVVASPAYPLDVEAAIRIQHGTNPYLRLSKVNATAQTWDVQNTGTVFAITDATASANRLTIDTGTGYVGIGTDSPSSLLTVANTGDVGRQDYTSQTTGWRITRDGAADFRYLFVDEMHAKSFVADLEQALAGAQIISKSVAVVHSAFTCPTTGSTSQLIVRDLPSATGMAAYENSDWVILRTFSRAAGSLTITECVGTVALDTSYGTSGFLEADSATNRPATHAYTFTRGAAGCTGAAGSSGASESTVPAESLGLDFGTTGNGYAEVNAIDGARAANSPYYQIVTWATCPVAANRSVRMRLGNLAGVGGYSGATWGLLAGDLAKTNITADATNGIRIRYGETNKLAADTDGNLALTGALTVSGSGSFAAGDVTLTTDGVVVPFNPDSVYAEAHSYRFSGGGPASTAGMYGYAYTSGNDVAMLALRNQARTSGNAVNTILLFANGDTNRTAQINLFGDYGTATYNGAITMKASYVDVLNQSSASVLYVDGTNSRVGIGAVIPSYTLDVSTAARIQHATNPYVRLSKTASTAQTWDIQHTGSVFAITDATASANRLVIDLSGNVGLGVTPSTKLDIDAGAIELVEMSEPDAGAANTGRLYVKDNGSGKSQLCVRFASGASQCVATEP